MVESHLAFADLQFGGSRRIALLRLEVEDLVDHARIDQRALQRDLRARQPAGRVIGEQQRGDEGKHRARRLCAVERAIAGIGDDAGDGEAGQHFGDRRQPFGDAGDLVGLMLGMCDQRGQLGRELAPPS